MDFNHKTIIKLNLAEITMYLISRIKQSFHCMVCTDPILHGVVLNLYLNGEAYPQRVLDYFPYYATENEELSNKIKQHMRDEDKHVALYSKALNKIQQPVLELPIEDCFNHIIRQHMSQSFTIDSKKDSSDQQTFKLANFLAHAHYLEKRVTYSLEYHLDACLAMDCEPYIAKAVQTVLDDELRHVQYTQQSVFELLPTRLAKEVLQSHQRSEQIANLDFSSAQVMRMLSDYKNHFSKVDFALYRMYSTLMLIGKNYV